MSWSRALKLRWADLRGTRASGQPYLVKLPTSLKSHTPGDRIPTVIVPGFLSSTQKAEDFRSWRPAQERLSASQFRWCAEAFGCSWRTGSAGDYLGSWPLPIQVAAMLFRRSSPTALAAATIGDACAHAFRMQLLFREVETAAAQDASLLAEELRRFEGNFRVIAFSLGCRLMLETLPLLPPSARPLEVHLCAAAATEEFSLPLIPHLCSPSGKVYHYYSPADEVLNTGFMMYSVGKPAIGTVRLPKLTTNCASHDASNYLGLLVHSSYSSNFDRMATNAMLGQPPPALQGTWLRRQRTEIEKNLRISLERWNKMTARSKAHFFRQIR